jgi:hypothetical protein
MSITVEKGIVARWNRDTGWGFIHFLDRIWSGVSFKSVDFASGSPARLPKVGDKVRVIMNGQDLALVRLEGG